jgi:antitoxin component of RelBE/YafQ-DinJ toxin-antitoxin module
VSKGTTRRSIRIEDDLWEEAKAQAESEGLDASDLIRQLLRGWLTMRKDERE